MRKTLITKEQRKDAADQLMESVVKCGPGASLKQAANSIRMEYSLACSLSKQFNIKPIPKVAAISEATKFIPIVSTPVLDSINKALEETSTSITNANDSKDLTNVTEVSNNETKVDDTATVTTEVEAHKTSSRKRLTDEERKNVIDDYKSGKTLNEICSNYNIVSQTIYNILKKEGVELISMGRKNKNARSRVKPTTTKVSKSMSTSVQNNNQTEATNNKAVEILENSPCIPMDELEKMCENTEVNNTEINAVVEDTKSEEIKKFFEYFGLDTVDPKDITEAKYDSVLEVGLVADRHDMPVNEFIFNYISNEMMFNYAAQEKLCDDFINNHFKFDKNGRTNKKLVLYVTGLQCALGSIIKVASKKNMDLVLKHFNSEDRKYYSQTIFGEGVVNATNNPFENLSDYGRGVYFYKCDSSKFANDTTDIYSIKLVNYKQNFDVSELEYTAAIITDSYDKIWEIYPRILMTINDGKNKDKEKLGVFIHDSKIANGKFYWGNNMSKGYNK